MKSIQDLKGLFVEDGLGIKAKTRYKKRRQALAKAVGHPIFIPGLDEEPGHTQTWYMPHVPLNQDPEFLYLTGLNQTASAILLIPKKNEVEEILFLPSKDPKMEFWEGYRFGTGTENAIKEAQHYLGFTTIESISDWKTVVEKKCKTKKMGIILHQSFKTNKTIQDHFERWQKKLKRNFSDKTLVNISPTLSDQRLCLDKIDIQNFESAAKITTKAFKHTLSQLKKAKTETQISGYLDGHIASHTPFRNSFPSIVAGGENAAILHYTRNNQPLKKSDLLLLDFGARVESVTADVSRTVPISGTFNPLQALLYNIVLEVQVALEKQVKPGITIKELNDICWTMMETLLKERVLDKGGKITRAYERSPHNVSHLIGHQVHDGDPFRDYRTEPLKPGQVISKEPGFYGKVTLKIKQKQYSETLGIRIEDDLLITKTGCKNLTKSCPKTIKAIEAEIKKLSA